MAIFAISILTMTLVTTMSCCLWFRSTSAVLKQWLQQNHQKLLLDIVSLQDPAMKNFVLGFDMSNDDGQGM